MQESNRRPVQPFAPVSGPTAEERAERRTGAVLVGKYRLEAVLGVGGMAAVYRATHRNGNRVAIKMLHPEISADPDLRARFVREGYVANSIAHEGTVRVLDDDVTEDGAAFLVMDLLEGETLLAHAARTEEKLPTTQVVALADRILDVLVASHAAGVIHRDIKPENVFVTTEGALHLLDFGVARVVDPTGSGPTRAGRVLGTPAFMPPEQALGRAGEIDERSDLWAVGATMFTLITGRYVHDAETPEELLVKTATQPVRPLATCAPEVPSAIGAVIDRALAFEKRDRFASAREMREALGAAVKDAYGTMPERVRGVPAAERNERRESIGHARTIDASDPDLAGKAGPSTADALARRAPTRPSERPVPRPASRGGWAVLVAVALLASALAVAWRGARDASPTPSSASGSPSPSPSAAGAPAAPRCTTNAQCASAGDRSYCRKDTGACVALTSPDCDELLAEKGDAANDATIWIGAMVPRQGPDGTRVGAETVNTLDLARRDFVAISSGVPGGSPTAPSRPIGIVLCDDFAEPARAAHHLVDDLGVPAVMGFGSTRSVLDLTPSLFNAKHVLALAALNTSPMLANLPVAEGGARLLWRVTSDATTHASVIGAFARSQLGAGRAPLKAVVVRADNAGNVSVGDAVVSHLRDDAHAELATFLVAPDRPERDVAKVAAEVRAAAPDVVVLLGGGAAWVPAIVVEIEKSWPDGHKRPRYFGVSTGMLDADDLKKLATSSPELRSRVLAIDTPASIPANVKLSLHYNEVFSPPITPATTFGPPYDGFYLLAYSIVALADAPVTGDALAKAILRLQPPGQPIDVGPASILSAYTALRSGKNIDLNGTTSTLDYDVATGDPAADDAIYCLKASADHHGLEAAESGLVFSARTQKLAGRLDCP